MVLDNYISSDNITLKEAMELININATGNLFICEGNSLYAAISDGDIRRAIIKGASINDFAYKYANKNPTFLFESNAHEAERVMREKSITAVPIVDKEKRIVEIRFALKKDIVKSEKITVPVVIMAGGKGTRLKPYTDILPKPLIPIGDKTITEHIIDKFFKLGCSSFEMIVNYKKEFIKAYFSEDPEHRFLAVPRFVEENEYLGTGGGLSLLRGRENSTFFLTNCDILIDTDYASALNKHKESGSIITMICTERQVTIPYGTVDTDEDGFVKAIKEKPTFKMVTNTGFYIIEPGFLEKIPLDTHVDITDIIALCIKDGEKVGTYLVDESDWMDMGQLEEMERMKEKMGII